MKRLLLVLTLTAAIAPSVFAAGVQVIANPSISASDVSADDLKDIFLGAKNAVGGSAVEPVLAQSGEAHDAFLKTYLGKSDQALRSHFKSLVFTGKGSQPKAFASDAEIVKYVASTKGAIGYISAGADAAGAKKLQVK
jgi:ABC-type phosphate transport system substrate-binding protein